MKMRYGFVSNSSSSSFIIACSNEPNKESMLEAVNVPKESMLYETGKNIAWKLSNVEEITLEELLSWKYVDSVEDLKGVWEHYHDGMKIYRGVVDSDSYEAADLLLFGMDIKYGSPDLIVDKDAGVG